ncbi:MAG: putative photosynthetic complex assembly protein PuhE [Burkholderiaceae bacterium]
MFAFGFPPLFVVLAWWLGTAATLWLVHRRGATPISSLLRASALLALGLIGIAVTRSRTDALGAYTAFISVIAIWGWQEVGFLTGILTGPRRVPCPAVTQGSQRLRFAVATLAYHELALVGCGVAIYGISLNGSNPVALWTFCALWILRLSAKLNFFLGVRNFSESFLPKNLRYLQSYFARRPMNLLMPFSIGVAGYFAVLFWTRAWDAPVQGFVSVSLNLLATLLALGVLEHILMVTPWSSDALWRPGAGAAPTGLHSQSADSNP